LVGTREIPSIGSIRAAELLSILQTPYRLRTKRQLWTYCGLAVVTSGSADHEVKHLRYHACLTMDEDYACGCQRLEENGTVRSAAAYTKAIPCKRPEKRS
jgi:hypothetical protein